MTYPVAPRPKRKFPIWAMVLIGIGALCFVGAGISTIAAIATTATNSAIESPPPEPTKLPPAVDAPEPKSSEKPEPKPEPEPELTVSQKQAIGSAESYLDSMGFSRKGLISQLEFEGFSNADAKFAVDYIDVNWKVQAVRVAESYLDSMHFSRQGLIDQLEFEGFTTKQAEHGATEVGL